MDSNIDLAIVCLRHATQLYNAVNNPPQENTGDSSGTTQPAVITRRMAAQERENETAEQKELHVALRRQTLAALDGLRLARSSLLASINGPTAIALRCQKCCTLTTDMFITQGCQHRLCAKCLLRYFEALFVRRVEASIARLPVHLRRPPPALTSEYVIDVRSHGVRCTLYCPLCSAAVTRMPLKNPFYSDLLAVVSELVHVNAPSTINPNATISCYF